MGLLKKGHNSGTAREETQGQGSGEGLPCCPGAPGFQHLQVSTDPDTLQTPSFWVYGDFIAQTGLIKSLVVGD